MLCESWSQSADLPAPAVTLPSGLLAVLGGASNTRVQGVGSHHGGAGIWGPPPCTSRSSDPRLTPCGSGTGIRQCRPQTPTPDPEQLPGSPASLTPCLWQSGLSLGALFLPFFPLGDNAASNPRRPAWDFNSESGNEIRIYACRALGPRGPDLCLATAAWPTPGGRGCEMVTVTSCPYLPTPASPVTTHTCPAPESPPTSLTRNNPNQSWA